MTYLDYVSMIFVGIFWGCTNPLLRHEALQSNSSAEQFGTGSQQEGSRLLPSLKKFSHVGVLLPYILNQAGSLLFYLTLGNSDISASVPICNGLALFFSVLTSFVIGEKVDSPVKTIVASSLIVFGVAMCVGSSGSADEMS